MGPPALPQAFVQRDSVRRVLRQDVAVYLVVSTVMQPWSLLPHIASWTAQNVTDYLACLGGVTAKGITAWSKHARTVDGMSFMLLTNKHARYFLCEDDSDGIDSDAAKDSNQITLHAQAFRVACRCPEPPNRVMCPVCESSVSQVRERSRRPSLGPSRQRVLNARAK